MMKTTFQSILQHRTLNSDLEKKGYCIFDCLPTESIAQLIKTYHSIQTTEPNFFYSSTHSTDIELRKRASKAITDLLSPILSTHLKDYKLMGAAFVVKPALGKGMLQPHQDWNLVDESNFRSYNIWIPLVDVNEENGAVFVLESSHTKLQTYRGPGLPPSIKANNECVWPLMKVLPMKAGAALLYDHALIHGSPPNKSDKIRIGIVAGILPIDAPMKLYTQGESTVVEMNCTADFFLNHNPNEALQILEHSKVHDNPVNYWTEESLALHYPNNSTNNLLRKLLKYFEI